MRSTGWSGWLRISSSMRGRGPLELEELPAVELLEAVPRSAERRVPGQRCAVAGRGQEWAERRSASTPGRVNQLLLNLVQNALAASDSDQGRGAEEVRLAVSRESGRGGLRGGGSG